MIEGEHENDLLFAWLHRESPVSELEKPMADHECRVCGQVDCHGHEDDGRA